VTPRETIGVDLGGTKMAVGVVDSEQKVRYQGSEPSTGLSEEKLIAELGRELDEAKAACPDVVAAGLGIPATIDFDRGVAIHAVNLTITDVPVRDLMQERIGLPVYVDNDANVAALAEHLYGAGRGAQNVVMLTIGTGIGGGLILNGRLYYGHFKTAGEIGHMVLFPGNPLGTRSLEQNCSRTAVVDRLVRLISSNHKSMISSLTDEDLTKIKSKTIGKAYADHDDLAVEVLEEVAELLGTAIAGVVTLLSLPRVVLGGGLTEALGQPFVDLVQKSTRRVAFPDLCKKVDVVASKLEDNAGVFGAAMIAMERAG
jgi:glucokinase